MHEIIKGIDATLFRAVHMCVGEESSRPDLGGVFVEPHPDGGAILVATDAKIMAVAYDKDATVNRPAILSLNGKRKSISSKPDGSEKPNTISAFASESGTTVMVINDGNIINGDAGGEISLNYPDWRGCIPEEFDKNSDPRLDYKFLRKISKATKVLGCCVRLVLSMRSGGPNSVILIRSDSIFTENIFWVVMPVRTSQAKLPEFYTSTLPKQKGAA